jgi:UDPglucose--hexose-1-phosphate uridylyltransferase
MPEIRTDPVTGAQTIVAGERSRRPGGEPTCTVPEPIDPEADPFAEGHEDRTPPELYAERPGGGPANSPGWRVRVVPNLFPALTAEGTGPAHGARADPAQNPPAERAGPAQDPRQDLFGARPAKGAHEVIVNAPDSVHSLAELPRTQVEAAVEVWRKRMRTHSASAYVQLIVNERREAGASLAHTHAQLYALDFVPADVARERERAGAYAARSDGADLLGDLVAEEIRRGERVVALNEEAVLIAPFGSRVPYQLMLAPRRPNARFEQDDAAGADGADQAAALLHDGLRRLARRFGASPPLNLWVRTAPKGTDEGCWRIDIFPRLTHLAGLELSTGVNLNIVAPEDAAAALRDEGDKDRD